MDKSSNGLIVREDEKISLVPVSYQRSNFQPFAGVATRDISVPLGNSILRVDCPLILPSPIASACRLRVNFVNLATNVIEVGAVARLMRLFAEVSETNCDK